MESQISELLFLEDREDSERKGGQLWKLPTVDNCDGRG